MSDDDQGPGPNPVLVTLGIILGIAGMVLGAMIAYGWTPFS